MGHGRLTTLWRVVLALALFIESNDAGRKLGPRRNDDVDVRPSDRQHSAETTGAAPLCLLQGVQGRSCE